jgi:hypothetical protein
MEEHILKIRAIEPVTHNVKHLRLKSRKAINTSPARLPKWQSINPNGKMKDALLLLPASMIGIILSLQSKFILTMTG